MHTLCFPRTTRSINYRSRERNSIWQSSRATMIERRRLNSCVKTDLETEEREKRHISSLLLHLVTQKLSVLPRLESCALAPKGVAGAAPRQDPLSREASRNAPFRAFSADPVRCFGNVDIGIERYRCRYSAIWGRMGSYDLRPRYCSRQTSGLDWPISEPDKMATVRKRHRNE